MHSLLTQQNQLDNIVCKEEDDYIRELEVDKGLALWRAKLSNDEVIIQDDGRPGQNPYSSWLRLKQYIYEKNLEIVDIWVSFRGLKHHFEFQGWCHTCCSGDIRGYFFSKHIGVIYQTDISVHCYLIGYIKDNFLTIHKLEVPSLILLEIECRNIDCSSENIIWNTNELERQKT